VLRTCAMRVSGEIHWAQASRGRLMRVSDKPLVCVTNAWSIKRGPVQEDHFKATSEYEQAHAAHAQSPPDEWKALIATWRAMVIEIHKKMRAAPFPRAPVA